MGRDACYTAHKSELPPLPTHIHVHHAHAHTHPIQVDPFHTLFGLAGLSLLGNKQIKPVNPVFCMPEQVLDRIGLKVKLITN